MSLQLVLMLVLVVFLSHQLYNRDFTGHYMIYTSLIPRLSGTISAEAEKDHCPPPPQNEGD